MGRKWIVWIIAGMLALCGAASAESGLPEALIREALLSTMPAAHYPDCECFAEGHTVLGSQERDDGSLEVYLAACVVGYGFMGGGFTEQSGWSGPCTVVLERTGEGGWALSEVKEIEDYNEMPAIMPDWARERFFSLQENDLGEQIDAQLQAYLDSIGRTEPILTYAETGGELSGMLVTASNFSGGMFDGYPLGCTTKERLESDGRYLYNRAWTPDENGVQGIILHGAQGDMAVDGTTGTETLTRTRKADGKVMETITIRVDLDELTIELKDDGGSIRYVFPYDEWRWTYGQPTVTREGQCNVDTARIERRSSELPVLTDNVGEADAQAGEEILAQTVTDRGERFTLARRQGRVYLRAEQWLDDAWTLLWQNDDLVPDADFGWASLDDIPEIPGEVSEYERFSVHWGDRIVMYAGMEGEDHETVCLWLERSGQDIWQVVRYNDHINGIHAYIFEDRLLFNAGDFSQTQIGGLAFEHIAREADGFEPMQLKRAQERLKARVQPRDHIEYFSGTEPLYVSPGWKLRAAVHTAPRADSPRAANGKASVSFADWVTILCREGDWMMVLYETSPGHYRTGWVDAAQDVRLTQVAAAAMERVDQAMGTAFNLESIPVFDDPINKSGTVCVLPAGTEVSILAEMGADLYYIEVTMDGQTMRGFVRCNDVGNG